MNQKVELIKESISNNPYVQLYTIVGGILIATFIYIDLFQKYTIYAILFIVVILIVIIFEHTKEHKRPKNPKNSVDKYLTNIDVEFAIYDLKKKIITDDFLEREYLFCWDDIPGNDSDKLKSFFAKNQPMQWVKNAQIDKNGNEITICQGNNSCSLKMNKTKTNAILKIAESKNYEFIVKEEIENQRKKLNVYRYDPKYNIIIGVDRGGAIVGGMLAKNLGLAITTLAISYVNPPKSNLKNIDFSNIKKILLVDDAIRRGDHMEKAMTILQEEWAKNTYHTKQIDYLFTWDKNKKNDYAKLIEYLKIKYVINWEGTPKIQPSNDGKTIDISDGNKSVSLRLNKEIMKVSFVNNGEIPDAFIAIKENKKINIYSSEKNEQINENIDSKTVRKVSILFKEDADISPDYRTYRTKIPDIYFPWDKMHLDEDMEKDKLKQFEELCKT